MKVITLETLYLKLKRQLLLAESYTGNKSIQFIIKACRLKPTKVFIKKDKIKLELYRDWFDEYGNSIYIDKFKRIRIKYNDLSINKDKLINTDLYYGLSISKIYKISKLVFIQSGLDEDLLNPCIMVSFLGIDNYLRTYLYMYGEWKQVSSLLLGIPNLKYIYDNMDIRYFIKLTKKENITLPCQEGRAWLSYSLLSKDFMKIIEQEHPALYSILL